MSIQQQTLFIRPPAVSDRCDVDNAAAALVAIEIIVSSGGRKRLTYCGHHWDCAPESLRSIVTGIYDRRMDGIFEAPKHPSE